MSDRRNRNRWAIEIDAWQNSSRWLHTAFTIDRSKRSSNKAAGEECTGSVGILTRPTPSCKSSSFPVGYVEDAFETRTQLEVVFSGLLKVPGNAAHEESWIPRHEVDVLNSASRLVGQTRCERKRGLLPIGIEKVLDEEKGLKAPMRELDRQLIPFGQIKVEPRWCFDRTILCQGPDSEIGHLQLRGEPFRPSQDQCRVRG